MRDTDIDYAKLMKRKTIKKKLNPVICTLENYAL